MLGLAPAGRSARGTFHYAGCGCTGQHPLPLPALVDAGTWQQLDVRPETLSEVEAWRAQAGPIRVIYLLPHHNLTGGMKMLVQQMAMLTGRGHRVCAAFRGPHGSAVLPPWASGVVVAEQVLIGPAETYEQFLRRMRGSFDVVMVGYFTQLAELDVYWGPLLYWEQG